jgi:hypothetical protein
MGLKIHSLGEIPNNVERGYYIYILDYYNWSEPFSEVLRANFDKMSNLASRNDAVVIQGVESSEFYSDVLSWKGINGMNPEDVLPAIMITTLHPTFLREGHNYPKDKLVLIKLAETCPSPQDVVKLINKIFTDIKNKKELKNFEIIKEQKKGKGEALVDSLLLQPNFLGLGVNFNKIINFFKG